METTSGKWFSGLGMEDRYQISILDYPIDDLDYFDSFSSEVYPTYLNSRTSQNMNCAPIIQTSQVPTLEIRPIKQQKTSIWNSCTTDLITSQSTTPSNSHIISFEKSPKVPSPNLYGISSTVKPENEVETNFIFRDKSQSDEQFGSAYYEHGSRKVGDGSGRSPLHAQDHVIAERKRREKLTQRFIALSSIVPGLKKMDKASVLEEAIKYLKKMQDDVKTLEEQAAKRKMDSVVYVKRSKVYADSDENANGCSDQTLSHIQARVSDKDVLIKIHGENQKGFLHKILCQVEKLSLNVINTSVLPFGNSTVDVTIVAQVEGALSIKMKDVVETLKQGLVK
ncbi:basic helix-loop-helix (bHLH) DNA-binding superfamily protein [Euphorbia peplus]|nr:basic helix-loop-helix (bHLH) DNA-binding superfamily protein [Euphorbia peplus]